MTETESNSTDPVDAAIASLGEPLSVHRVAGRIVQVKVTIGLGLILLGIIGLVLWFMIGKGVGHGFTHFIYTPIILGLALISQVIWNRGVTIYTYPVGVLRVSRDKVETFLWDEITAIKVRSDTMKVFGEHNEEGQWKAIWIEGKIPSVQLWTTWIELTRNDGAVLKLTPLLDDFAGLSRRIQYETFRRHWPNVRSQLAQNEPVVFGPVTANGDGLMIGKKSLLWSDVKAVTLKGSIVSLGPSSYWRLRQSFVVWATPNPHVLIALIDERIGKLLPIQTPFAVADVKNVEPEESK